MSKKISITSGTHSNSIKVKAGDQEIAGITYLDIIARPGEPLTARLDVLVEEIDLELATNGVTIEPIKIVRSN